MLEVVPVGYEPLGNAPRAVQMLELVRIETAPLEIFEPQQVRQKDDEPSGDEERGVAPPGCARGRAFAGARASHVANEVSTLNPSLAVAGASLFRGKDAPRNARARPRTAILP